MQKQVSQRFIAALLLGGALTLPGCVAAGIHGTTYAVKASDRGGLEDAAVAGDPVAQTKLGISYCCRGPGFSTQKATEWLCRAAAQDFPIAQYELGRIYDGATSRTPAPGQKLTHIALSKKNQPLSLMWFERAAAGGHEKAAERAKDMRDDLNAEELAEAAAYAADWRAAPCRYDEAFNDD